MPTPRNLYPPINSYYNHLDYVHPFYGHHRGAILSEREQVSPSLTLQPREVSDRTIDTILDEEFNAHMFVAKPFPVKATSTVGGYSEFGCIGNTNSDKIEVTGEKNILAPVERIFKKKKKKTNSKGANSLSPTKNSTREDLEKLEIQIPARDIYEYAVNISIGKNQVAKFLIMWLFTPEHILHPYPNLKQLEELTRITGLSIRQVKYWFMNARRRLWKPFLKKYYELSKP